MGKIREESISFESTGPSNVMMMTAGGGGGGGGRLAEGRLTFLYQMILFPQKAAYEPS